MKHRRETRRFSAEQALVSGLSRRLTALIGSCCGGEGFLVPSRCVPPPSVPQPLSPAHRSLRLQQAHAGTVPTLFQAFFPPRFFHVLLVQVSAFTLSQGLLWKAVGYPEFVTSRGEIIIIIIMIRPHSSVSIVRRLYANALLLGDLSWLWILFPAAVFSQHTIFCFSGICHPSSPVSHQPEVFLFFKEPKHLRAAEFKAEVQLAVIQ